jgi:hypothetical protein
MVPKTIQREFTQIVHKPVVEEKVVTRTEWVPETIERQVQVPVTIMVAREITLPGPDAQLMR